MGDVHTWTATVGSTALKIEGGSLTLDEQWAPFIQAQLVIVTPDAATLNLLDPRAGARVTVALSQTPAGSTTPSTTRTFNLGLRSRHTRRVEGTTTLDLASDEALLQDYREFTGSGIPYNVEIAVVFPDTIRLAIPGATVGFIPDWIPEASKTPAMSLWDFLAPIVQGLGGKLWCNADRSWEFGPEHSNLDPALVLSYLTNLVEAEETVTREDPWANSIGGEYLDGAGTGTDWYSVGAAGASKGASIDRSKSPFPGYGELNGYLSTRQRLGKTLDITAVSDYSAAPARELTVITVEGTTAGRVSAVTFDFDTDQMTIRPREWTA